MCIRDRISGVVGLLFIGVGNYLPRVKQNYTLGIKTPWALADPENWRRTQRLSLIHILSSE